MRRERSRPLLDKLHEWLTEHQNEYLPRGPMAKAVGYALGNWTELTLFLDDVHLPPDNNRSEAALRVAAVDVSLCTLSSSARNDESAVVARNATRATRAFATVA